MFCKHDWKEIINDYTLSPLERLEQFKSETAPADIFFGTKIIILKCVKCGKLDKTIEKV